MKQPSVVTGDGRVSCGMWILDMWTFVLLLCLCGVVFSSSAQPYFRHYFCHSANFCTRATNPGVPGHVSGLSASLTRQRSPSNIVRANDNQAFVLCFNV